MYQDHAGYINISDGDPDLLWKLILIHVAYLWRTCFYINFHKTFFFALKISKTFVFYRRTSGEYLKKYRQWSVFLTDPWKRSLKTDPCLYLVKYSSDFLKKKTKVLDIFDTDKNCFIKINIESSPPEIWIRIRFHNRSGSPSLINIKWYFE